MPKLPVVSDADVVRTLGRLGFVVTRQRGSHIMMRRGSSGCVVPNHCELKSEHWLVFSSKLAFRRKSSSMPSMPRTVGRVSDSVPRHFLGIVQPNIVLHWTPLRSAGEFYR